MYEYRICWSASSNINFRGNTDWSVWEDEEDDAIAIENSLTESNGSGISPGMEEALDASGFEWWVETRETTSQTS